ncbi:MAG TPA: 6-pyruvoyl-tetrahydropterin synthase-related protein [Terriglobales bacterium]|nr:6-pyruvoyl-tetrahydropterin synthase-related protein [Terriglobales bacterium]
MSRWSPLYAVAAAAFSVEIPFFFLGMPSGHDVEFHLYSWLEVLGQWKQGILYPRWASLAHFGYGEPRFIFYPPASWMLGAMISAIFPWRFAAGVYIWLVLTLAGLSMFLLARRWFDQRDAIFAGVFYALNPYHLVIVYWRSAFAELLASCLVPLLVLLVLKAAEEGYRAMIPLSLVLAAAWLTNAPAAVMIHYSLALLVVVFACRQRSLRVLWVGAGAVVLGACLAGAYLLPAIYEQRWVDIAEAVSAGSRPQDNFLFIHTTDADHDTFNRIISWVAMLEIVATLAAIWAAKAWRKTRRTLWSALAVWALACAVLMFPITALLWRFLPKLEFMQFPWRWLLCLSLIFVIFITASLKRWWMRGAVVVVGILVVVGAWQRIQAPWWDNAGDLREMQDNMTDRIGYEGADEYTPVGADPSAIDKAAPNVVALGASHPAIHVLEWKAEFKSFTAETPAADELALRLFRYPAWKLTVNGQVVQPGVRAETGQMLVPVAAGMNRVQIRFTRTWDRTAGEWISLLTAWCLGLWIILARNRDAPAA